MQQELETKSRVWIRDALKQTELKYFEEALKSDAGLGGRLGWSEALRRATKGSSKLHNLISEAMRDPKPVRFVTFNKTLKTNWSLPWHQDRVIAVKEKSEVNGFSNWSRKAGIWHCEPPVDILEKMVFARVYLDSVDEADGGLEIALGSHKLGKILSEDIGRILDDLPKEKCVAKRGDILLVKALTLHRSSISHSVSNRRVMRVDYTNCTLPAPLEWKY